MSDSVTYEDLGARDQALIDEAGGGDATRVTARMVEALNGNGNAAIMLTQLLNWSRWKSDEDGWFYRTRTQMRNRCGLGKKAQKSAAATLSDLGLVETEVRGMPAKTHYRVRLKAVISLLADAEQDRAHGINQDRAHGRKQDRAHGSGANYKGNTESCSNSAGACESEAVDAYEEIFPRRLTNRQREKVTHEVDDLDVWRAVLDWWEMNGHRAKSVGRLLNKYRQTDDPDDLYSEHRNGKSSNPNEINSNLQQW